MQLPYGLILFAAIVGVLSKTAIKEYNTDDNINLMFLAIFFDLLFILSFVYIFKTSDIITSHSLVQILAIILVAMVGIFYYKEHLTMNHLIGILLGLAGIYFLSK
jgi:multidrug transporter EmrE-like cation transporter